MGVKPRETIGVLLMNLGGPDTLDAVEPFLYNLFSDRMIIKLGPAFMQKPIARFIAWRRAPTSRGYYSKIGGGSPLLRITRAQAEALEIRLREHGEFRVMVGMRYWKPMIEDVVEAAHRDGIGKLVVLSLYPQYSVATTGSSVSSVRAALKRFPMDVRIAPPYYKHPRYIEALADNIRKSLREGTELLYSAHSLPESFITKDGDPYVDHIMATIGELEKRLPGVKWRLGYQSRSGPVKWLEPPTERVIGDMARDGVKDVLVVPISFVSDHIETLYEVDILYKELGERAGLTLRRAESLNTHPGFIGALADIALREASEGGWA